MSKLVIADLTAAKSIAQELSHIAGVFFHLPIQPILQKGDSGYSMFEHFQAANTVREIVVYEDSDDLLSRIDDSIINAVLMMPTEKDALIRNLEDKVRLLEQKVQQMDEKLTR